ncbi:hypothetical protein [Sphingobium yanoikuyae]|uniref:hypothetical protein n=2 Tax=Sphingomonadaceae TaxID=41297 RepID=UPI0006878D47|nr:hypothetical protein [Sphingobium yanoikuyae]
MDSFKIEFGRQETSGFCESERLSMVTPKSRTYRLHLSEEGTDTFLECHSRLARIARRFIPYGTTLTVATLLLEALEGPELSDELCAPVVNRLAGRIEHFVGASPCLAQAAAKMLDHIEIAPGGGPSVTAARLFMTAIALMSASEDSEIERAYRRIGTAFAPPSPETPG